MAGAARWNDLGSSPIVNVHVVYDRRITRLPFAAGVDSPVQWVFDKTRASGLQTGQYLAISLSAADSYVDVPTAALREKFLRALEELFPAAREARVIDSFVTRERRATFRQAPGCVALRPGAATSMPGLVLAGAWTDTGWPDTMEGAVRSGHTAAEQLVQGLAGQAARELEVPRSRSPARSTASPWIPRPARRRVAVMTATMPAGVETARDLVGPAIAEAAGRLSPTCAWWPHTTWA